MFNFTVIFIKQSNRLLLSLEGNNKPAASTRPDVHCVRSVGIDRRHAVLWLPIRRSTNLVCGPRLTTPHNADSTVASFKLDAFILVSCRGTSCWSVNKCCRSDPAHKDVQYSSEKNPHLTAGVLCLIMCILFCNGSGLRWEILTCWCGHSALWVGELVQALFYYKSDLFRNSMFILWMKYIYSIFKYIYIFTHLYVNVCIPSYTNIYIHTYIIK